MARYKSVADLAGEIAKAVFRFEDECGEPFSAEERGSIVVALRRATIDVA